MFSANPPHPEFINEEMYSGVITFFRRVDMGNPRHGVTRRYRAVGRKCPGISGRGVSAGSVSTSC